MTGAPRTRLHRSLGFPVLVLYGLGTIIGAGIFVLIGEVARAAGTAAPIAFLAAGALAALTGLSYAELVARHPEAGGAAAFVLHGFRVSWLARLTGIAVAVIGVVASASIARGGAEYLQPFVVFDGAAAAAAIVIVFTGIACLNVGQSVGVAALISTVEIGGLVFAIAVGAPSLADLPARAGGVWPQTAGAWEGIAGGAFIAFFAYMGFESLANMAEETRDVARTLPNAILAAIGISALLYALVSLEAVLAVPLAELSRAPAPLVLLVEPAGAKLTQVFSAVALLATVNGILIEIIVVARLFYGMANRGLLPAFLTRVSARTRVPVRATLVTGGLIVALTLSVPFAALVAAASALTIAVFLVVNVALWRLKRADPRPDLAVRAPFWSPPLAALASAVLLAAALGRLAGGF